MIQQLGPENWERYRTIRLLALTSDPDAFGSTHERELGYTPEKWRERLAETTSVIFVWHADEDVGLVAGAPYDEDAGLFSMWVAPSHRRHGIAAALIEAVADWAKGIGYERLKLDVSDENVAAIKLYERAGFEPSGETDTLCTPREHITEHQRVRVL